jgi:hypothetical protein
MIASKQQLRKWRATLHHARMYLRGDGDALHVLFPAIGELSRQLAALNTGGAQGKIKHRLNNHWCGRCPDFMYEADLRFQWLDGVRSELGASSQQPGARS